MEKKDGALPTIIYPEVIQPSTTGKQMTTKRLAIISVSVVVTLALILGTVLLAIHLVSIKDDSHYEKEKTITAKDKDGKETTEKMYVNTKTKEESFETQKLSVVHDFKKSLTVIRTKQEDKTVCFITTLNSTGMLNPAEMEKSLSSDEASEDEPNDEKETDEKYQDTSVEVKDRGFLSPKAKAMCEGYPIYWMIPTGEKNNDVDTNKRQKRAICYRYWCYVLYRFLLNGRWYNRWRCYYLFYKC